jgi:hypothetical protein
MRKVIVMMSVSIDGFIEGPYYQRARKVASGS